MSNSFPTIHNDDLEDLGPIANAVRLKWINPEKVAKRNQDLAIETMTISRDGLEKWKEMQKGVRDGVETQQAVGA